MRLCQAPLDTCLGSPFLCQPLSSGFALHGLRAFEQKKAPKSSSNLRVKEFRDRALVARAIRNANLDDRQITHLICVRLRYLLYDFF